MNKKTWRITIIVCCMALLLSACSKKEANNGTTANPINAVTNTLQPQKTNEANNTQEGFLLVASGGVQFVQWTEVDKQLVGQVQTFHVIKDQSVKTDSKNDPFKGIRNGDSVSITLNDGKVLTGTLKNKELSLVFPDAQGNLNTNVYKPATVSEYNTAVSKLRDNVQDYNTKEQEKKAEAKTINDQQEAVKNANNKLSNDISRLSNLSESLVKATDFDNVMKSYQAHWNQMQEHQKKMKELASVKPFTDYQLTQVEYNLTQVEYDLTSIEYDDTSMDNKVGVINDYILSIKKQFSVVQSDWVTLQKVVSANTTGSPKAQFTSKDIEQACQQAQDKIDSSISAVQKASQQAKEYDNKANQLTVDSKNYVQGLKATD
ncbi:hypothetical protein [Paenibacillus sp. KN14-4R]|uniref:hypothetical protein n=1 Tax=Paenibacillus sp. KN14-4R TaxID=3445773 RepID=UPI003FA0BE8A